MNYERELAAGNINTGNEAACFCPYKHPAEDDGRGHPDGDPGCCNNPLARRVEDGSLPWREANRMARTRTIPQEILNEFKEAN